MDETLWAIGRATGIIALLLFTASMLLGIVTRSGRPLPGLPRFSVALVHRNVSLFSMVFLALHVGTLMFDSYAKLALIDVVLPFFGDFRPLWQGLGTIALDVAVALAVTGVLRHRIGPRVFRAVHWASYAMWPLALAHSLGNGTDALSGWFLAIAAACVVAVGAAILWRASDRFIESARSRETTAATAAGRTRTSTQSRGVRA